MNVIKPKILSMVFIIMTVLPLTVHSQMPAEFDFSLGVDFSAAEQTLDYFEGLTGNTKNIAGLRGNKLAAATSAFLARTEKSEDDFADQLELARNIWTFESDVYGFMPAKNRIKEIRKLLNEIKHRQFDRRIVATIASFFPEQAKISTRFSIYIVVIGNERSTAFVRRVVWDYDTPIFVGEGKGEPVIVLNLARFVEKPANIEAQFIEVLSTVAHECFHAAFSEILNTGPDSLKPRNITEQLIEIVQNEGIAYYLSLQTHIGGAAPSRQWFTGTTNAIETLNRVLAEMCSPRLTQSRAQELVMNANLSGSFEGNYGSTSGMRMAYEIDKYLGRPGLTATLINGPRSYFSAYQQVCQLDGNLPKLDKRVLHLLQIE